jgi:hypothetical protein
VIRLFTFTMTCIYRYSLQDIRSALRVPTAFSVHVSIAPPMHQTTFDVCISGLRNVSPRMLLQTNILPTLQDSLYALKQIWKPPLDVHYALDLCVFTVLDDVFIRLL